MKNISCLNYFTVVLLITAVSQWTNGCQILETVLTCYNNITTTDDYNNDEITTLELRNYSEPVLNISAVNNLFPNLINLTILGGSTQNVTGGLHSKIEILRLNNLRIKHIKESVLMYMKNLKVLDLRNNSFDYLHKEKLVKLKNLQEIYLSGNKWNCSRNLDWIRNSRHLPIQDLSKLTCSDYNFIGKPLLYVADLKYNATKSCPEKCSCILYSVTISNGHDGLHPMVEVNCSHQNLTEFPKLLPDHSTRLILDHNNIENLTTLVKNPIYREITDLFLDYNQIRSIEVLEGTNWIKNFRILSLKANKVTELHTYAMDNALRQNPNMPNAVMMFLGQNPWRCDCEFTPSFQEDILIKYAAHIQDLQEVRCSFIEGDTNSNLPVVQLSRGSICHVPMEYSLKALNVLNGVLASLIVLILGKLAYDYYFYKKTGKLPWIVTKIP